MLKKYESMIVIAPSLKDEDAKKENEKVHSFIKKKGGKLLNSEEWGKKNLAYTIRNFTEGYYFVNHFNFDALKISELERLYKLNENFIRYNILAK